MPRNMEMSKFDERGDNHENKNDIVIVAIYIDSSGVLAYEFWFH